MAKNLIKIENLSYAYRADSSDSVQALSGINLEIYAGEMLAITGHNGSGKSTLARHFNGLLKPQQGSVLIDGLNASEKSNIAEIRKIVGMVFQNPDNQLVSSVVEEDIAFGPENLGLKPQEIVNRVDWALEALDIEPLRHRSPLNLSIGQKQLVAIAGVLAMKPKCIVLDEPTAHLDPRSKREVINRVTQLNRQENITIILLTHFMNEAANCDRMIVMEAGKIMLQGHPAHVFKQKELILQLGLDFPLAIRLADKLRQRGITLDTEIAKMGELAESLCQLR